MAGYRQFHTQFWKDEWVLDLTPQEKLLYIYLFSNDQSSISGLYKIPLKIIAFETGLNIEFISETLKKFQDAQKIFYEEGVMWVVNMEKYHRNVSPRTSKKVMKDVEMITPCKVKEQYLHHKSISECSMDTVSTQYGYPMDTVSIQHTYQTLKEEDKDKEEDKEKDKEEEEDKEKEKTTSSPASSKSFDRDVEATKLLEKITGFTAFPARDRDTTIDLFVSLIAQHGKNAADYMLPYYNEWCRRKYRKSNFGWLDWAITGEIPPYSGNGNGSHPPGNAPPGEATFPVTSAVELGWTEEMCRKRMAELSYKPEQVEKVIAKYHELKAVKK